MGQEKRKPGRPKTGIGHEREHFAECFSVRGNLKKKVTRALLDQIYACKGAEAQRLLLGKSR